MIEKDGVLGFRVEHRLLETESHRYGWEKEFDDTPTVSVFFQRQR